MAFLLGALTFTPWDILLSHFGILEVRSPAFFGIAWWTPITFGLLSAGGIILFTLADRLFKVQGAYNPHCLGLEYLMISGFYLSVLFFRHYPYVLALSLLFIVLVRLIFFHRPLDAVYFIFGACAGPTFVLVFTSLNFYSFTEPDFLGMPYWLPVFWGNISLALRRVSWILEPLPSEEAEFTRGGLGGF
jgi:hypothetical protein